MRNFLKLIILAFSLIFIFNSNLVLAFYINENTKLDGTFLYEGRIGNLNVINKDLVTLDLKKVLFSNNNQIIDTNLNFERNYNISHKKVLDFKNFFYGISNTPQNINFNNISNVFNLTNLQYSILHNENIVSSFYLDGIILNFNDSSMKDLSSNSLILGYLMDYMISENTYYTINFENLIKNYSTLQFDDSNYKTLSFKILRKIPKVSRTPLFFTSYLFHNQPVYEEGYTKYVDLIYELKATYGKNDFNDINKNFQNAKIDYSLKLNLSDISKIAILGYVDRRAYLNESIKGYYLNYDKSNVLFLYSHALTPKNVFMPYVNLIKTNYLNVSGFNINEITVGGTYKLKYSSNINWDIDFKNTTFLPFESKLDYPKNSKFNTDIKLIRYLSAKQQIILNLSYEAHDFINETYYFANYKIFGLNLENNYKIKDNYYLKIGIGGKNKKHETYLEKDIIEAYGLIGLKILF